MEWIQDSTRKLFGKRVNSKLRSFNEITGFNSKDGKEQTNRKNQCDPQPKSSIRIYCREGYVLIPRFLQKVF